MAPCRWPRRWQALASRVFCSDPRACFFQDGPAIDEFAPWQQRLALKAVDNFGGVTGRRDGAGSGAASGRKLQSTPARTTPDHTGDFPASPRFGFRRRPKSGSGGKRGKPRPKSKASTASFASPRCVAHVTSAGPGRSG